MGGLHHELKLFFERLIWFDEVLSSHTFDNDLDYYLSLDFVRKATSWGVYRQENYEGMCSDIEQLVDKYDKNNWKESTGVTYEKVEKMFYIISNASINIQKEMSALNRNRSFLVANDIISIEEITELNTCVGKHVEFLGGKGINYGASLYFLFEAYRKIKNIGSYDDEICIITWHQKGAIVPILEYNVYITEVYDYGIFNNIRIV